MRLEWDENKNSENLQKHGFDFADAWQLFNNPLLVKPDIRKAYGEDRWIGIGTMNNGITGSSGKCRGLFMKEEQT